ncbi:hypothetical protein OHJ21_08695 [Virgibacillus sp. LDC1]|uniref:hypothetical protein n=1 Tax=Paenibacillus TaxID=44249 RepID=UPI002DB7E66A|nr:hypothetical protein [Paenibacillus lautus]MCV4231242.1 hypothetical protein [Virgibacillus sp. LDC1]MEC0307944.1 hypothetical protein [Paenibacillus lautus]
MYSKSNRILISVVFIVCLVGGVMVFQNTYAKSTTSQSHTNSPNYPENEHGQTYGSAEETTSVEMLPDLIHAGSVNGIKGYLLKKDYLGEPGDVPLYDVYGKTIIGSFHISDKHMNYPKNKNGQTYGSSSDATSPKTEPELISAIGVDGTAGYVLKKDLDGELPKSPEEAIAIQNRRSPDGHDIPLFDVDGETVIGVFHVGGK